ncbi:MAG: DUF4286 family protein [Dehalococcoidales bacterium]|nr:DUF4286 family protein [Dehalococcoidales bacterium]
MVKKIEMKMINIVGTECLPEVEEKFNKWYNEDHAAVLIKFPGLLKITRFKMIEKQNPHDTIQKFNTHYPKYITIYEFESEEAFHAYDVSKEYAEAHKKLVETWGSTVREFNTRWRVQYEPIAFFSK